MGTLYLFPLMLFTVSQSLPHHIIDMTYTLGNKTIHLPGYKGFRQYPLIKCKNAAGIYTMANDFYTIEHMGTHVDAPIHFVPEGLSMAEVPIQHLIGPAIIVDISKKSSENRDALLEISDFKKWENTHGPIPEDCIVLVYTGWGKYWENALKYYGDTVTIEKMHFPGLSIDAAIWLIGGHKIKAVGIDTPSVDNGSSKLFEVHQLLLLRNITIFENVANLEKLPPKGFTVYAMPLPIENGSGAPMRMIGVISNKIMRLEFTKWTLIAVILVIILGGA